jgi:hypothetical protein
MGQDRLNCFATLSINCDLTRKLDLSSLNNEFQRKKLVNHLLNKIFKLCLLFNAFAEEKDSKAVVKYQFKSRFTFWCFILFHIP